MSAATRTPARWQIGSLAGVPVYLGTSWVFVAIVVVALFGPTVQSILPGIGLGGYAVAAVFALLLLVSVLVHEAAHALTARRFGFTVQRIVADFWGGHTAYQGDQSKPGGAAAVAFAGPLANGLLALAGGLAGQSLDRGVIWLLLAGFTYANGFVAVFNLLPGLPLDGGFLLEALVWKATGSRGIGTMVAGWVGRLLVVLLIWYAVGIPLAAGQSPQLFRVLWVALIAAFLWAGATRAVRSGRSRRRFEVITIGSVWRPVRHVSAAESVDAVPWAESELWLVTDERGEPFGIVDERAVAAVPSFGAASTPVSAVSVRQPRGWVVDGAPEDSVLHVVGSMQSMQSPVVAVRTADGHVPAVIFAADL
ncbi:MAG: M50 family metallopeptidase [Ornithinimicrobium sp.]